MTTVNAATTTARQGNLAPSENPSAKPAQVRLTRRSPAYWRVTIDNPPINVMGPKWFASFRK